MMQLEIELIDVVWKMVVTVALDLPEAGLLFPSEPKQLKEANVDKSRNSVSIYVSQKEEAICT